MNVRRYLLLLMILILPINVFAYPNKLIVGGQNIGIEVKTKGILVVDLYEIDGKTVASTSGIKKGDYIVNVNDKEINSINDYSNAINEDVDKESIDIKYLRNNKEYKTVLNLYKDENEYKTGLYVKDKVSGIGTLTFIDPETRKYGALGHEILDSNTNTLLNIDDGLIYDSYITGISKAENGVAGEKEATIDSSKVFGDINLNTVRGIFGSYTGKIDDSELYDVATEDEIKIGDAQLYTVIDGKTISSYNINIENINKNDKIKNIVFTINDKRLLNDTGGIVQGMSGSPIIQNGKIVGAVTHVVVENPKKGYGIFITNMIDEVER